VVSLSCRLGIARDTKVSIKQKIALFVYMCIPPPQPAVFSRQLLGKNVTAETKTHRIQELLDASLCTFLLLLLLPYIVWRRAREPILPVSGYSY
jgi:hypothetical protein